MSREYSFTLTLPLGDLSAAEELMVETRKKFANVRVTRKTDRGDCARFYLSFPLSDARPDLGFQKWFEQTPEAGRWELFGPTHGCWGLL